MQQYNPQYIPPPPPLSLSDYQIPDDVPESRKRAIKGGIDWILRNPAPSQDDALEVGEEIMLWYQLHKRAGSKGAKDFCREYIRARIEEIVKSGRLENPAPGEITVLVPVCEIMSKLGLSLFDYPSFIREKALYVPDMHPGYRIWTSFILERMGFYPPAPAGQLFKEGAIATELGSGQLLNMMESPGTDPLLIRKRFYAITHEIFPLTDFGDAPIAFLQQADIVRLQDLVLRGIFFHMKDEYLDLLCELVISAHLLDLQDETFLDGVFEFIIDHQIEDGSFGIDPHANQAGRSNPSRHPVFVSVWALIQ